MMQKAEHIIGLLPLELSRPAEHAAAVRVRYQAILRAGFLQPRSQSRTVQDTGSSFALDHLAGDTGYIFLSVGPRYRSLRPPEVCYGFAFDAEQLIRDYGALVGPDLLQDYEDALDEIIGDLDEELGPLAPITEEELHKQAAILGMDTGDTELMAYLQVASTSRRHDLETAIKDGDMGEPGAEEAVARFRMAAAAIQAEKRFAGRDALARLAPGMEILVPCSLPLSLALYTIEAGQETPRVWPDALADSPPVT